MEIRFKNCIIDCRNICEIVYSKYNGVSIGYSKSGKYNTFLDVLKHQNNYELFSMKEIIGIDAYDYEMKTFLDVESVPECRSNQVINYIWEIANTGNNIDYEEVLQHFCLTQIPSKISIPICQGINGYVKEYQYKIRDLSLKYNVYLDIQFPMNIYLNTKPTLSNKEDESWGHTMLNIYGYYTQDRIKELSEKIIMELSK